MIKNIIVSTVIAVFCAGGIAAKNHVKPLFYCSFDRDAWDPNDWIMVKSSRWDHFGKWVQSDAYIQNETPADALPEAMISSRAAETYTSMVLAKKFAPDITIRSTMEFTYQMAPLIVIAPELGRDDKGRPEYREHFEVIIYNKGINIWHHNFKDGKPWWKKIAESRFALKPNTQYDLMVTISKNQHGKMISVLVDGHHIGILSESFPDQFHVGITGCEGDNHFYNFQVKKGSQVDPH
jgi:hypothetical protein